VSWLAAVQRRLAGLADRVAVGVVDLGGRMRAATPEGRLSSAVPWSRSAELGAVAGLRPVRAAPELACSTAGPPGAQDAMLLTIGATVTASTMPERSGYGRAIVASPRRRRLTGSAGTRPQPRGQWRGSGRDTHR
jgi:hypothetical protein